MVWIDNISELEFYNQNNKGGCYYDMLGQPGDLLLQAQPLPAPVSNYSITINTCKPDGTYLATDTTYFNAYMASVTLGGETFYYCNIMLNNYSPAMLANGCFILEVIISEEDSSAIYWDKYTQAYKIGTDAVVAAGITAVTGSPAVSLDVTLCSALPLIQDCGIPYLQFVAEFECVDNFTGDYYGDPGTILRYLVGNVDADPEPAPFPFVRLLNIPAYIKDMPRAIKRTISINCRTQRTETTPKYQLIGKDTLFPLWKMQEIENMLLADHLFLNGAEYQSEGGTVFAQAGKPNPANCVYSYTMNIPLQGCYAWQDFGCTPACTSQTYYYPINKEVNNYFNDTKQLIAIDIPSLTSYFYSIGATQVVNMPLFNITNAPIYAVLQVKSSGVLPKYIYGGTVPVPVNKIYPRLLPEDSLNLNKLFANAIINYIAITPVVGSCASYTVEVQTPGVGTCTSYNANQYILAITGENGWVVDYTNSIATQTNGIVSLELSVFNSAYNYSSPLTPHYYANLVIAQLSAQGCPNTPVYIFGDSNPNLPAGAVLAIYPDGSVAYTGYSTYEDSSGATIEIAGINYSINN